MNIVNFSFFLVAHYAGYYYMRWNCILKYVINSGASCNWLYIFGYNWYAFALRIIKWSLKLCMWTCGKVNDRSPKDANNGIKLMITVQSRSTSTFTLYDLCYSHVLYRPHVRYIHISKFFLRFFLLDVY